MYVGSLTYDEIINTEDPIVIYGAGENGNIIFNYLKRNEQAERVVAFIDAKKKGGIINNVRILGLDDVIKSFPEAQYIVSGKYAKEMWDNLYTHGIRNIHFDFLG